MKVAEATETKTKEVHIMPVTNQKKIDSIIEHFDMLDCRWESERGLESFSDFKKSMKEKCEAEGFTFMSYTSDPMKLTCKDKECSVKLWVASNDQIKCEVKRPAIPATKNKNI